MDSFKIETMIRDQHIDRKAAELVRNGVPPYLAIKQAAEAVDNERANRKPVHQIVEEYIQSLSSDY